jgi:flagellar biosynthesis/type III secretory pathway M-ring protein FliF/YscJ
MTYLGTLRDVNHYHASETLTDGSVIRDAYYDKATGILLEMTLQHSFAVNVDETDTDSEHWKVTQFNEAAAPTDGTDDGTNGTDSTSALPEWVLYAAIVAVVVVAATLIAVVILRRRKKPEVQAPPPAPVQPPNPV